MTYPISPIRTTYQICPDDSPEPSIPNDYTLRDHPPRTTMHFISDRTTCQTEPARATTHLVYTPHRTTELSEPCQTTTLFHPLHPTCQDVSSPTTTPDVPDHAQPHDYSRPRGYWPARSTIRRWTTPIRPTDTPDQTDTDRTTDLIGTNLHKPDD